MGAVVVVVVGMLIESFQGGGPKSFQGGPIAYLYAIRKPLTLEVFSKEWGDLDPYTSLGYLPRHPTWKGYFFILVFTVNQCTQARFPV